jgi:hypothetical protein
VYHFGGAMACYQVKLIEIADELARLELGQRERPAR